MKPPHELVSLRRAITLAEAGIDRSQWYDSALSDISEVCEIENWDLTRFVHKLAILSPRCSVRRNIRLALQYVGTGRYLANTLPAMKASMAHYETTGEIRGYKVPQFAAAILGDQNSIVLDTWMHKALLVDTSGDMTVFKRKATMAEACKLVINTGNYLGICSRDAQAAIWTGIIREHGGNPSAFPFLDEYANWLFYGREYPASGYIAERTGDDFVGVGETSETFT